MRSEIRQIWKGLNLRLQYQCVYFIRRMTDNGKVLDLRPELEI